MAGAGGAFTAHVRELHVGTLNGGGTLDASGLAEQENWGPRRQSRSKYGTKRAKTSGGSD